MSAKRPRGRVVRGISGASDKVLVVHGRTHPFRDLYHSLLTAPWWVDVACVVAVFLVANLLFACAYAVVGGVANASSFQDLFFFSVQTMGTIGYGAMYPHSAAAHWLVTCEAILGVFFVAIVTGITFAKFSVPRAQVQFAKHPVIAPMDGVPTLMFRVGNERDSHLIEATLRVVLIRTIRTKEGMRMYRMVDVPLARDRSPALTRSWLVMHTVDAASPLHGMTAETMAEQEVEFILSLSGVDEVSVQTHHARHRYTHEEVRWGVRHADMLTELEDGTIAIDMAKFHELQNVTTRSDA